MLPGPLRLRRSRDFSSVMRLGYKVARPTLILYARSAPQHRFGVIVGRNVGGAVTRNLVKRRLRHQAWNLIRTAGPAMDVVVRALPRAGAAGPSLVADLVSAWAKAEESAVVR